jgi:cytochrome P450
MIKSEFSHYRPPGPKPKVPYLFGLKFLKDPLTVLNDLATRYGDISYFRFGKQDIYFIRNPDYIQNVLVTNPSKFIKNPGLRLTKRVIGEGLLTSEGEFHKRQRGLLQPAFDYKHIAMYGDLITSCGEAMCKKWSITSPITSKEKETIIDIHEEMTKLTLSIISNVLFGSSMDSEKITKIIQAITTLVGYFNHLRLPFIGQTLEKLPLPSSRRFHSARKELDLLIFEIINEHKSILESHGVHDLDNLANGYIINENERPNIQNTLLSKLLLARSQQDENGTITNGGGTNRLTEKQIRDEIMTLFLAGHETTANALSWTFYLISQNPNVETLIVKELRSVLDEGTRRPVVEDISKFQYLRKVFTESLRLYPPVWAIGREAIEDITMGVYTIPAGSILVMSQFISHRDSRFFPQPDKFIPERWTIKMKSTLHKFAYFPFGGGPRICMGEPLAWIEGILLLVTILRYWKMEILSEHPVVLHPLITLRPKYGIKMIITPR